MQGMVYRLMPKPVPEKEQIDVDKMSYYLDSVYKLRPMPPEITERDEPYAGIANDYSICFLWLGYNLQERMTVLDAEIKSGESGDTTDVAGKKAVPRRDTTGLGGKQLAFRKDFDQAIREARSLRSAHAVEHAADHASPANPHEVSPAEDGGGSVAYAFRRESEGDADPRSSRPDA